jgi:hypothetical protein
MFNQKGMTDENDSMERPVGRFDNCAGDGFWDRSR